jgi:copper chaperone
MRGQTILVCAFDPRLGDSILGGSISHKENVMTSTRSVLVSIEGMTCGLCEQVVRSALSLIEGVRAVSVEMGGAELFVHGDAAERGALEAIEAAGYPAAVVARGVPRARRARRECGCGTGVCAQ